MPEAANANLRELATLVLDVLRRKNLSVVTAESCTAGKLAVLLSEVPGAAKHLQGGFVVYTKANKAQALGVPADVLRSQGAVCPGVSDAMAAGALARTPANVAVAITGVAGPDPDQDGNPVGLVCIAVALKGQKPLSIEKRYGKAPRERIQERALADALKVLLRATEAHSTAALQPGTQGFDRG